MCSHGTYHGEVRLKVALLHRFEKKMLIRAVNDAAQEIIYVGVFLVLMI